jgi:hypothetical protein
LQPNLTITLQQHQQHTGSFQQILAVICAEIQIRYFVERFAP